MRGRMEITWARRFQTDPYVLNLPRRRRCLQVKKPVHYCFADAVTLKWRYFLCCEDVRVNRRLAPATHLRSCQKSTTATAWRFFAPPLCVSQPSTIRTNVLGDSYV